jgi:hypothetical protein
MWVEITKALTQKLPRIFELYNSSQFHSQYICFHSFLAEFESRFDSAQQLTAFRASGEYTQFMQKWNPVVYFQLRFGEAMSVVDTALSRSLQRVESRAGFVLFTSDAFWAALLRLWDPSVLLREIVARVLKLSLQILARFNVWCRDCIAGKTQPLPPSPQLPPKSATPLQTQVQATLAQTVQPLELNQQVDLLHDIRLLQRFVQRELVETVTRVLREAEMPDAMSAAAQSAFDDSVRSLEETSQFVQEQLLGVLRGNCTAQLSRVAEIATQYRLVNKSAPAGPSAYVGAVLQPLREFLDATYSRESRVFFFRFFRFFADLQESGHYSGGTCTVDAGYRRAYYKDVRAESKRDDHAVQRNREVFQ